ncbi:MAG: ABC transporter permease [Myxococcales bacterium]|nr:ABC transporter permease [Myxococcales bacterium]
MRNTLNIAGKELSIYFTTTVGYTGFGAYAFLMGLFFTTSLNKYQQLTDYYVSSRRAALLEQLNFNDQIITPMLSSGLWMFLFFIPFLTMRQFAEEKSGRTFELLMTAPIRSIELVLGKFISVACMIFIFTIIPVVFPVVLNSYGSTAGGVSPVEWAPVFSGFVSIFLMGLTCASIGIFVSSLTESQIVAALCTFAILLIGFVLPLMAQRLEGDWRAIVEYLTPVGHVGRGLQGRLRSSDLVYFTSVTTIVLYFTHRVVEAHRWR